MGSIQEGVPMPGVNLALMMMMIMMTTITVNFLLFELLCN